MRRSMDKQDSMKSEQGFASPPCLMHELDPTFSGFPENQKDPEQERDVKRWRKAEREQLIKQRLAIPPDIRRQSNKQITAHLEEAIGDVKGLVISCYWPFKGEPNLHPFMKSLAALGGVCALPVVVSLGKPLFFRAWSQETPMTRGVWNIPVPQETAPVVVPDVVIAPLIGFDPSGYRLGYGGGFYDRTLAGITKPVRVIGVGYQSAAIPTIFPQWHDIPMDSVITEQGRVPLVAKKER